MPCGRTSATTRFAKRTTWRVRGITLCKSRGTAVSRAVCSLALSYTLSKSSDDGSNQRDIIPNTYDASNLWGPSEFDTRHVLIVNYLYELPIFRHNNNLAGKVLGGWQLSGIFQAQTGTPTNVGKSTSYAFNGVIGNDGSMSNIGEFWNYAGGGINYTNQMAHNTSNLGADPSYWFNPNDASGNLIFTQPAPYTFNNQKGIRDLIYNPGFNNWNMGLFKKFKMSENR